MLPGIALVPRRVTPSSPGSIIAPSSWPPDFRPPIHLAGRANGGIESYRLPYRDYIFKTIARRATLMFLQRESIYLKGRVRLIASNIAGGPFGGLATGRASTFTTGRTI